MTIRKATIQAVWNILDKCVEDMRTLETDVYEARARVIELDREYEQEALHETRVTPGVVQVDDPPIRVPGMQHEPVRRCSDIIRDDTTG